MKTLQIIQKLSKIGKVLCKTVLSSASLDFVFVQ